MIALGDIEADRRVLPGPPALGGLRLPAVPVEQPWDCSAAAVITPHLPRALRRVPHLFDRLGAIRLSDREIGIDGARPVAWSDVVEVRTRPVLDVIAATAGDGLATQVARLVPPVPVLGRVARGGVAAVADRAVAAVLAVLLASQSLGRPDVE